MNVRRTTPRDFLAGAAGGGDDPIFALNAEARRRAAAGEAIVNATVGALLEDDGSLFVLPSVADALAAVPAQAAAAYAPIAGDPSFMGAVVHDLFGGTPLDELSVAVATPGGSGALHLAIVQFLAPGQAVLSPSFYWGPYHTMAVHARRRLQTFPMFDARGRFDLAGYEQALDATIAAQGRALVLLNFPCNNPTGYSLDEAEWEAVAEITARAGRRAPVALLVDHAYARFAGNDGDAWLRHAPRLIESTLLLVAWSASKSFLQYGARVGALVAVHGDRDVRDAIADALSYACRGTWSNCNHRGLLAVGGILADDHQRARTAGERRRAIDTLMGRVAAFREAAAATSFRFPRYEGGFFVSVFTDDGAETARRMRESGVFVVPMDGAVRVALCSTPKNQIPRLVGALDAAVIDRLEEG